MRIVFAGLPANTNYGDVAIFHCCKTLASECLSGEEMDVVDLDLQEEDVRYARRPFPTRKVLGLVRRIRALADDTPGEWQRRRLESYYASRIAGASVLIVAGGGLIKYSYQRFWFYLDSLLAAAQRCNVPVVLNAVGVEGYDPSDAKCRVLKNALSRPIVKAITTRDDLKTLKDGYLPKLNDVFCDRVADPAVWSADAYGVKRDASSDVVGVGLVRGGIFRDNGIDFGPADVVAAYVGILNELDARGISWKLFTNGIPQDLELAQDIFQVIHSRRSTPEVAVPTSARELVETIAGFKGVIAARLHANILSYSLGIPSVGLVWNDKLPMFGACIGYPERFIGHKTFNQPGLVVDRLTKAMEVHYDETSRATYRETAKYGMRRALVAAGLVSE